MANALKKAVLSVRIWYEEPTSDPETTDADVRWALRGVLFEALSFGGKSPFTALEEVQAASIDSSSHLEPLERWHEAWDREGAKIEPLPVDKEDGTTSKASVRVTGFDVCEGDPPEPVLALADEK